MKYTKGNWVLSASDATLVIVIEELTGMTLRQLSAMCKDDPEFLEKIIKLVFARGKLAGMREAYSSMNDALKGAA